MLPSSIDLKTLLAEQPPRRVSGRTGCGLGDRALRIDLAGLPPGPYTISAGVVEQQHKRQKSHVVDYPPMQLARDGRDEGGWYPIATLDVP